MYSFHNLNDVEFEYLCNDVMSRILGVGLQRFASGKDGGIDLADSIVNKTIIVQVKHYVKTGVSGFISSMKREKEKVKKLNPQKYYVCCSLELSPEKKKEIFEMFSDYMESENNIKTSVEISDFLDCEENADILRKHFKLWVDSKNVLDITLNRDVFIDSEVLLHLMKERQQFYVTTQAYEKALRKIEKSRVLLIIGNPGVGKTVTSEMIVLHFACMGYKVRYSTDGSNLSGLKKSISDSKEVKEVILVDDCFGQAYFCMKETQESELSSLVDYIMINENKVLVMNSRVTIFNDAKDKAVGFSRLRKMDPYILDMSDLSDLDKARIFCNMLYFSNVPNEYVNSIVVNKRYRDFIKHKNYNPRLIEYVTNKDFYQGIPPENYNEAVSEVFQNPEEVWKNEYERRLQKPDRILLTTLYSLTNTTMSFEVVEKCYNNRISKMPEIDKSVNQFNMAVTRLQDSMIRIIDDKGTRKLSVLNPSINDYLSTLVGQNDPERESILSSSVCVYQLKRLLSSDEFSKHIRTLFSDKEIVEFVFESDRQKLGYIAYGCSKYKILDKEYAPMIARYIENPFNVDVFEQYCVSDIDVLIACMDDVFRQYYNLDCVIHDPVYLQSILSQHSLDDSIRFVNAINHIFNGDDRGWFVTLVDDALREIVDDYKSSVPVSDYDVDLWAIVRDNYLNGHEGNPDYFDQDTAEEDVKAVVSEQVIEEINILLLKLPEDIAIRNGYSELDVEVEGAQEAIDSYVNAYEYEYDDDTFFKDDSAEIDYIFEKCFSDKT